MSRHEWDNRASRDGRDNQKELEKALDKKANAWIAHAELRLKRKARKKRRRR